MPCAARSSARRSTATTWTARAGPRSTTPTAAWTIATKGAAAPASGTSADDVFCTFYDPGHDIAGGCFTAIQASANCYEFYLAGFGEREADREVPPGPLGRWVARASRRGEPSTCQARPTV